MPTIDESVYIDRSPDVVWDYVSSPGTLEMWSNAVQKAEMSSDSPEVGARIRGVSRFLGKDIPFENEVTVAEPAKAMEVRTVEAPFPMRIRYDLEAEGDGTRFRYHLQSDGAGGFFGKMGDGLVTKMYARQVRSDLENLKDIIEALG